MTRLTIELDDDLALRIERSARSKGVSPSQVVGETLRDRFSSSLPESFFAVLGSWEDERTPAEILADIRTAGPERDRPALD